MRQPSRVGRRAAFRRPIAAGAIDVTWLREALFDRQIVDLDGRRVIRIADVVLSADGDQLEVVAVEVGAAAVLRRLGFSRLAARIEPQLLAIDRLQLATVAAGPLLLDAQRARLEQLEGETVTDLLSRLPVPVAENAVRESRHREAVARDDQKRRPAALPADAMMSRLRIAAFIAVLGPGVLAGPSDDDPAGITTYSILGADHGYELIWVLVVATAMLILYHAIAVRIGAVTGQGLAGLIRERFGVRMAFAMTTILIVANLGTTAAEFAGIASALGLAGVPRIDQRADRGGRHLVARDRLPVQAHRARAADPRLDSQRLRAGRCAGAARTGRQPRAAPSCRRSRSAAPTCS